MRHVVSFLVVLTLILLRTTSVCSQTTNPPKFPPYDGFVHVTVKKAVAIDDSLGRLAQLRAREAVLRDSLGLVKKNAALSQRASQNAYSTQRDQTALWKDAFHRKDMLYDDAIVQRDNAKAGTTVWRIVAIVATIIAGIGLAK